ncbi:hypothetical protein WUBG_18787, partial [Wuchereria bancrofti]
GGALSKPPLDAGATLLTSYRHSRTFTYINSQRCTCISEWQDSLLRSSRCAVVLLKSNYRGSGSGADETEVDKRASKDIFHIYIHFTYKYIIPKKINCQCDQP